MDDMGVGALWTGLTDRQAVSHCRTSAFRRRKCVLVAGNVFTAKLSIYQRGSQKRTAMASKFWRRTEEMAQLQRSGAEAREQRSLSRANSILNRETERRSTRAAQDSSFLADTRPVEAKSDVAIRAYECWHERGCPEGSPEIDWYQAEK